MKVKNNKIINLALQGGGAHGAFSWGVLDYFLEDGRIDVEGVSATSAGAMNAIALAHGLLNGDKEEARNTLMAFWKGVSEIGDLFNPFLFGDEGINFAPNNRSFYHSMSIMSEILSPYDSNPMNYNPLIDLLKSIIDFDAVKKHSKLKLNFCATNVETSKIRIFKNNELCPNVVMASACLPSLFQAVCIDGEYFWDGGYMGDPAFFPLIYDCNTLDILIVHVNPIIRKGVPKTSAEIANRMNEISFNASLMREMRAIAFVSDLIKEGRFKTGEMKLVRMHAIRAENEMSTYDVVTKKNTNWDFLINLRDKGRNSAKTWFKNNYDKVGKESSIDIDKEYL